MVSNVHPKLRDCLPHGSDLGRDDMNLAEFPLATLADRPPAGCKTLVFEDEI